MELIIRQVDKNRNSLEDPTNLVQNISFSLCANKFSAHNMLLLGGLGHTYRKILKIRYNEIEFGSNFNCSVTLLLQATCTLYA